MTTSSPLFKGATRPACIAGVPIKPFVINIGVWILLALYIWVPLILLAVLTHIGMMKAAEKDDQIFGQLFSYFNINIRANRNRINWHNVTSLSPKQLKKTLFIFEQK